MVKYQVPGKFDTKTLSEWQKKDNVFLFSGRLAQIILVDMNDPIGIMYQRPFKLNKVEDQITGVFILNNPQVIQDQKLNKNSMLAGLAPEYFCCMYHKLAKCFVHTINSAFLGLILGNPEIEYVSDAEHRDTLRKLIRMEAGAYDD